MATRYDVAKRLYNPGHPGSDGPHGAEFDRERARREVIREEERRRALFKAELVVSFLCGVAGATAYALLC